MDLWKSLRRPENPSLVGFIRFLDVRLLDYRLYSTFHRTNPLL
jgi:hypothetical protein